MTALPFCAMSGLPETQALLSPRLPAARLCALLRRGVFIPFFKSEHFPVAERIQSETPRYEAYFLSFLWAGRTAGGPWPVFIKDRHGRFPARPVRKYPGQADAEDVGEEGSAKSGPGCGAGKPAPERRQAPFAGAGPALG